MHFRTAIFALVALAVLAPSALAQKTPEEAFDEYKRTCAAERASVVPVMYESSGRKMPLGGKLNPADQHMAEQLTDMMFWNLLSSTYDVVRRSLADKDRHKWNPAELCAHRVRLTQIERGGTQWPYPTAHKPVDDAHARYYSPSRN